MNYRQLIPFALFLLSSVNVFGQQTLNLQVNNPCSFERKDVPIVVDLSEFGTVTSAIVTIDGQEVPCQLDDLDQDGTFDELVFVADLGKKATKTAQVSLYETGGTSREYAPRTYAEMVMRNGKVKEKNKHDIYISSITVDKETANSNSYNVLHHHGVAFESELIAMRIYLDQRQTIDLYGKFHKGLELKETQFYTSDEQKAQGYGDDVLWVGNTFGLGALRGWDGNAPTMLADVAHRTQRILAKGPVRTIVEVEDKGWKMFPTSSPVNMTIRYTLYAGHRDFDVDVTFNRPVPELQFSTGIINVKNSVEFTDKDGLRACWGTDWPASDTLKWKRETVGLAVCIPAKYRVSEQPANQDNYGYVLKAADRKLHYSLAYTSDNEDFGYHSSKAWFDFVKVWKKELENPVVVTRK
ncbi:MAG: DUF4861 domain-containing protein [Prevotella sp.]|nr:DUF4861 domain-containing protein [Prevotella sp.]